MANMTFKTNLLPNSNLEYSLGSATKQWVIYGNMIPSSTAEATIGANDSIVIADASNNDIVSKSSTKFDGVTTTSYLSKAGSFEDIPVTSVDAKTGNVILDNLIIGNKSYNGSSTVVVAIADLGLSQAMTFKGVTDTPLVDGQSTTPVNIISGGVTGDLTPSDGDVVLQHDDQVEFIYTGNAWYQLGLVSSYAMANHTHGNILNNGVIGDTVSIATNDGLVITDSSDGNTVARSTLTFDTGTSNKALSQAGSWIDVNIYASSAGFAQYSSSAGYAATAGRAIYSASAGYAATAGRALDPTKVAKAGDTMTGNLNFDFTGVTRAKNTLYNVGTLSFKNAANSVTYSAPWLRYIGTDGTDGFNTALAYGSINGTTWLTAGESGATLPTKLAAYNDENLYLSADGAVKIYTGAANDGTTYNNSLTINSNGTIGAMNSISISQSNTASGSVTISNGYTSLLLYNYANGNHGVYDNTGSKWICYATKAGDIYLNGRASCAVYAGTATSASQAIHSASAAFATNATNATHASSAAYAATCGQIGSGAANRVAYYSSATALTGASTVMLNQTKYINGATGTFSLWTSGAIATGGELWTGNSISTRFNHTSATAYKTVYTIQNNGITQGYFRFYHGTAATAGYCDLMLGNARPGTTAYNAIGRVCLYNKTGGNTWLQGSVGALGGTTRNYCTMGYVYGTQIWGAVWNDYAEMRQVKDETIKPGRCVIETGDGDLVLSTERLQDGGEIISDTYGFCIGQTETAKTPIATTGRVLAYPYENIEVLRKAIGKPVSTGPDGTISLMSNEEAKMYPWKIIGTISEIPSYDTWKAGEKNQDINVDGRIWIRIR